MGHAHHSNNLRRVTIALVLTGTFMVVEVIGGILSGSLALLADAGHMLTDTMALALAAVAFHVSKRPPDAKLTYGYQRFQILRYFLLCCKGFDPDKISRGPLVKVMKVFNLFQVHFMEPVTFKFFQEGFQFPPVGTLLMNKFTNIDDHNNCLCFTAKYWLTSCKHSFSLSSKLNCIPCLLNFLASS